jgi:hypothetical protein
MKRAGEERSGEEQKGRGETKDQRLEQPVTNYAVPMRMLIISY